MNSVFFYISKIVWLLITPDSLLLILLMIGWVLLWRGKERLAKQVIGSTLAVLLAIAFFPVDEWLLYPLETRFSAPLDLPDHVDGILVLSGPENSDLSAAWNQVEMIDGAERLLAFQVLANRYPNAKLVFSGGSGSMLYQGHKGADVAKMQLEQQGLSLTRVIFESESRNTFENATFSKVLAKPRTEESWILITSAFHMPRSMGIFCKVGWPTIPYPVDHRSWRGNLLRVDLNLAGHLAGLAIAVKEWIGLAVYYATGKSQNLIPTSCS